MSRFAKVSIYIIVFLLVVLVQATAFSSELTYTGIQVRNASDNSFYNKTMNVTTYVFVSSVTCSGAPDASDIAFVNFTNGNVVVPFNHTVNNSTIYIKPSIEGVNQSCFKYATGAQAMLCENSNQIGGVTSDSITLVGQVTGTTGASVVSTLDLDTISYTNLLGFNNITKCSNNEILKMTAGGDWNCENDNTGSSSDSNASTACSGTTTYLDGENNCDDISTIYVNEGSANQTFVYCSNITGSSSDLCTITDTDTNTQWPLNSSIMKNQTGGVLGVLMSGIKILESQITDLVHTVNELWTINTTTFVNKSGTLNLRPNGVQVNCSNIFGTPDTDFCTDTSAAGGGNSTEEIRAAVNASGLNYLFSASNLSGSITESQISDLTHTTDTNESTRFGNLVGTNCTGTNKVIGVNTTGGVICAADVSAAGGGNSTEEIRDAINLNATQFGSNTTIKDSYISGVNSNTCTALAANGANCNAGSYPLGVDASGAVESCTDASTEIDSSIATHALTKHGNTTTEIRDAVNDTVLYQFNSSGVVCTNCLGTQQIKDSYLLNTGDTGSGSFVFEDDITVELIKLEVDSANHNITDNATCVIIRGDTSTLNIC